MEPYEITSEEEALYNMSDEELEAAFRAAKAERDNPVDEDIIPEVEEVEEQEVAEIDDEVEEIDELEQPEVDSGEQDQEEEVEEDEAVVEEPEESDNPEEVEVAKTDTQKYSFKANGQEFEFTEDEIKSQFGKVFGQAMNYTQKMQELKPWRTTISALKDNKISHEDINLMIDVLKGDKQAIAAVLQKTGVDSLDIDTDNVAYAPKEYGRSDTELEIADVVSEISRDQEYGITAHIVDRQWDDESRRVLAGKPEYIKALHIDVKTGEFDKINPLAIKYKVADGGRRSDIDYYMEAAKMLYSQNTAQGIEAAKQDQVNNQKAMEVAKVKNEEVKQAEIKKAAVKRKAAAPTNKVSGKKDVVDYLDDNDDTFDDWYKKLQSSI